MKYIWNISAILLVFAASSVYALEKPTHEALNENIVYQSNIDSYLKNNLGLSSGILARVNNRRLWEWIKLGGKTEDEPAYTRSRNHFHDPLQSWDEAGLNSGIFTGMSSALWIQDQTNMRITDLGGDWSWKKARQFYYAALTGNSTTLDGFTVKEGWFGNVTIIGTTTMNEADRDKFFAWTFRAVGQAMHLMEDASVPSHTRNDGHAAYNYENYVENVRSKNSAGFNLLLSNPRYFSGTINNIASFVDTNQYVRDNLDVTYAGNIGLAEYTNANFFSEDTIFKDFPHPAYSETTYTDIDWLHPEIIDAEDGLRDNRIYIRRTVGDADTRLASISYITYDCVPRECNRFDPMVLDDVVYNDYASLLLPRAVGYSAGLLNYFFRGSIELSLPSSGIYSSATSTNTGFARITVQVRNTTSTGEDMNDGSIQLVVKYKLAQQDPFQSLPVDTGEEFFYKVVSEENNVRSIPKDSSVELTFNLGSDPIPFWATDVYLQLVYHGKLGNEDGSVAVGFKDISEPTPVDLFNNMDKICLNGNWFDAGSQVAIDQAPWWDVYAHNAQDGYLKIAAAGNDEYASSSNYTFVPGVILPGTLYRSYVLSDYDYPFNYSNYTPVSPTTSADDADHTNAVLSGRIPGSAIKNQVDYHVTDEAACTEVEAALPCDILTYPILYSFRGTKMWGPVGFIIDNPKYPIDTNCSWETVP